jgi:hypothetical protein
LQGWYPGCSLQIIARKGFIGKILRNKELDR